jgi:hypothetical protein
LIVYFYLYISALVVKGLMQGDDERCGHNIRERKTTRNDHLHMGVAADGHDV